jgi:hypothetical protein
MSTGWVDVEATRILDRREVRRPFGLERQHGSKARSVRARDDNVHSITGGLVAYVAQHDIEYARPKGSTRSSRLELGPSHDRLMTEHVGGMELLPGADAFACFVEHVLVVALADVIEHGRR